VARERLDAPGGRLKVQSTPGGGTRLEATVLFRADRASEKLAI